MTAGTLAAPAFEEVLDVVTQVWASFVGAPLTMWAGNREVGPVVARSVDIVGDWGGSVQVCIAEQLAVRVASAMFALPAADLGPADVADAVGEVTNMVGGNIKSLLPGECRLLLPRDADARDGDDAALVQRLALDCAGEPLVVSVWRSAAQPVAVAG